MPRASADLSPAMRQYVQFKQQHPGYVLFFRMGDFYEMFWDDARTCNKVLGVTLTSRNKGAADEIPMAGVPFHAVEGYLRRMIAAGYKVAICEQMEDPATAKGVIRREVTRLMTPGTLTDDPLLDGRTDNFLAAVAFNVTKADGYRAGLAWVELSTGAVVATSATQGQVLDELARLRPAEVLVPEHATGQPHEIAKMIEQLGIKAITPRPGWQFTQHHSTETVKRQWQVSTVGGFGFPDDDPGVFAIAAVLAYLEETQKSGLAHLRPPRRHSVDDHLFIDPASWRSLEVDRTVRSGGTDGTLLSAIDRTRSSMGGRLLRQWLRSPLRDVEHITARQDAIAALLESPADLKFVAGEMEKVCDIERIVGRLAVNRASPRDLAGLGRCLSDLSGELGLLTRLEKLPTFNAVAPELIALRSFCDAKAKFVASAIMADPAPHLREGGVIAAKYDAELDRLRALGTDSQAWLVNYQADLAKQTGIDRLKVAYNKVFGYYIEVGNAHKDKAPAGWTRKQTTTTSERYITAELKSFETEALGSRDRAIALEQTLFEDVRQSLLPELSQFQELAGALARLDVIAGLALLAQERRYCRPTITEDRALEVIDGRHPVLDQQLGAEFVANDVKFAETDTLALITGPNMAGKSTYIRQAALCVLLAQCGSYVPAKSATIGVADRLFTRIGASDELHSGQSTFMVEMTETANILNNATERSLVVLDEIGRGTSTLDGLSLAWAIAEHVATTVRSRTLFATHYHELTDLANRFRGVRNLNVAVREWEDQVVFLHRIVEGGTDRSYGIHVARLAGVPKGVLERARQLLSELAVHHVSLKKGLKNRRTDDAAQLPLFEDPAAELFKALAALNPDSLSPMQAHETLREWKQRWMK
ncbi:MAG TPA: DNA mismatch repair protein MutS [Tepidisphaeraceae bacterium]|nr:DNA mismatch repair protein MutS [Tepidisphaeraceae bacterium]